MNHINYFLKEIIQSFLDFESSNFKPTLIENCIINFKTLNGKIKVTNYLNILPVFVLKKLCHKRPVCCRKCGKNI